VRIGVRLFGALAERAGRDRESLDLSEGATAADVLRAVGGNHPEAAGILDRISVAVNLEVVPPEHRVGPGDEVALLPPVAGGEVRVLVGFRARPSADEALRAVRSPEAGGTAVFVGSVRAEGGRVERLEYSAYEAMGERVLREIAEEAASKWPLEGVAVLHGVGELGVGDPTVAVACSASHRAEALDACRYVIDEVKRRAPIWKKEAGPGGDRWIGLEP
jgi:molybdopterin converting factor subunit 1